MDEADRASLALDMARHVMAELAEVPAIATLDVLAPHRPDWWSGAWVFDRGRGLNCELEDWRNGLDGRPIMIIHADLPLLEAREVSDLLAAATEAGAALATDHAGTGTNALAISDGRPFRLRFGTGSRVLHVDQGRNIEILRRPGLMYDIDSPADYARWQAS